MFAELSVKDSTVGGLVPGGGVVSGDTWYTFWPAISRGGNNFNYFQDSCTENGSSQRRNLSLPVLFVHLKYKLNVRPRLDVFNNATNLTRAELQGYLTYKKMHPPRTLPGAYA